MPRRNTLLLIFLGGVSLLCYQKVSTNRYGRVMVDAMDQIAERSLRDLSQKDLFEGAMQGMVGRLEDRYSAYVPPGELRELNETLDQEFAGLGMEVGQPSETDQLTVANPVVGRPAPAYEAGIRAGDVIRRVDDHSTQGVSLEDAVAWMRGASDSPVLLSVLHAGQPRPVEIEIQRKNIQVDTVLGDVREPDLSWNYFLGGYDRLGYVRIRSFSKETTEEMRRAMEWLRRRDLRGLVLDLRDNPGGLLTAATDGCDLFVDSGVIVTTRRRHEEIDTLATQGGDYLGFPMAVLVNQLSASASEIVAACLQDRHRAVVVGQRTWGKGTVQEVISLPDGQGALRLTTASYWRPSKHNIHKEVGAREDAEWGVKPDPGYEVAVKDEELAELRRWRVGRDVSRLNGRHAGPGDSKAASSIDKDRALLKAVEYLQQQLTAEKQPATSPE